MRTLNETGVANNTFVMFTSDHGSVLLSAGLRGRCGVHGRVVDVRVRVKIWDYG